MVAAPGMLLNVGKELREVCAARAILARFTCQCYPPNQSGKVEERDFSFLASSFLSYFSISSSDQPCTGAEFGRFECFVFLFLAEFCQAFFCVFFGQ